VDTNYDDVIYDVTSNEINRPNDLTDQRLVAEAAAATGQTSSASAVATIPCLCLRDINLPVTTRLLNLEEKKKKIHSDYDLLTYT